MANRDGSANDGESTAETVRRLAKDLWYGNGKAGLCTRMEGAEKATAELEKKVDKSFQTLNEQFKAQAQRQWALILLVLTLLGGMAVDIVKNYSNQDHRSLTHTSYTE